jgi:hypothetical protein
MKLIKSTIFASLALATMALASCSDDNNYVAGNASNGAYFPDGLTSTVEASNEVSVYEVPVYRVSTDSPTSYNVTSTIETSVEGVSTDGITIPSSVSFDGSSTQTTLPITYDVNKVTQDVAYIVTLALDNASDYGNSTYEFTFTVTAPKVREAWDGSIPATSKYEAIVGRDAYGTGSYELSQVFSGSFAEMNVYTEYNPNVGKENAFDVVFENMFDWYDNNSGKDFRIVIPDLNDRDEDGNIYCTVEPQSVDYPGYDMYIADRYNYLVGPGGYDPTTNANVASWKNASTFNPSTGLFTLHVVYYSLSSGGVYGYGEEYAQLDGYPDCTLSITYTGRYQDTKLNNYVAASFTSGEDVGIVHAALLPPGTAPSKLDEAVAMLANVETQEVEAGDAVEAKFQIEDSGSYMIVGVTYDSKGEAQDFAYLHFYADLSVEDGWTSVGEATFTDGWFLPFLAGDPSHYPWDVEVRQNKNDNRYYQLVIPYNCDNFKEVAGSYNTYINYLRTITFFIMDENYVEILPQYAGFGSNYISYAEVAIANLEGMLYSNYKDNGYTQSQIKSLITTAGYEHSTCDSDMIITIPYPYSMLTFSSGANWVTATSDVFGDDAGLPDNPYPAEIIMPESTIQARAMHAAKKIAKPTFKKLSTSVVEKQFSRIHMNPLNRVALQLDPATLLKR